MDTLLTFFAGIRLRDVADILINSYVLFRLYALFRGTNVFRILMGIAVLWFIQRIAVSLGLVLTSWVIQGITAVAALIIIIVFRNEIRSVLQARNLRGFFWGFPRASMDTPVEVIVDAVYELARRRIGALLVLLGKEDLGEVIHSGIPWHGLVSREMILSIFWHDNPVHDGAAIIQGDQITEAGAILPLSQRKDLPFHYGTRHRAAAGLAEATDALVIAISEERGTVATAKGSQMRSVRGKEQLSEILREHLDLPEKEEGGRKKEKLELALAGFVSVIFVSAMWFSFTRGLDTLITFEIPVEYMNRNTAMEIVDTSVKTLRVDLSGSGALARSVRQDQIKVRVDLSKAAVGRNAFNITEKNITLPPGVVLESVTPQVVEVSLDRLVKKAFPVQVDWVGTLSDNLRLVGAKLTPERVLLTGGSRILNEISTVYTEQVSLDNIEKTGTITAGLDIRPASLKIASESKDTVTVDFVVKERLQ